MGYVILYTSSSIAVITTMNILRTSLLFFALSFLSNQLEAHIERSEPMQSLRQSYFALVGITFGSMSNMIKGKIEWDAELFAKWARDLENTSKFGVERGFLPGMEGGKTRARPEIWLNSDDFNAKLRDFREATASLAKAAAKNDRDASREEFAATGKTCKACHDDYKSRNYLN